MSARAKRRSYFVDKKVQGALLVRVARYWLLSVVVVGALTVLGWMFISPGMSVMVRLRDEFPSLLGGLFVAVIVSLSVLPVILYDLARLSNRFAGPMLRLRRAMRQTAAGERVESIYFRNQDYWQEFADAFNDLNKRLQTQEDELKQLRMADSAELSATV